MVNEPSVFEPQFYCSFKQLGPGLYTVLTLGSHICEQWAYTALALSISPSLRSRSANLKHISLKSIKWVLFVRTQFFHMSAWRSGNDLICRQFAKYKILLLMTLRSGICMQFKANKMKYHLNKVVLFVNLKCIMTLQMTNKTKGLLALNCKI